MNPKNFLYVNNSGCDLGPYDAEISKSLKETGDLPKELSDLFIAYLVERSVGNPDGTPRYMIYAV